MTNPTDPSAVNTTDAPAIPNQFSYPKVLFAWDRGAAGDPVVVLRGKLLEGVSQVVLPGEDFKSQVAHITEKRLTELIQRLLSSVGPCAEVTVQVVESDDLQMPPMTRLVLKLNPQFGFDAILHSLVRQCPNQDAVTLRRDDEDRVAEVFRQLLFPSPTSRQEQAAAATGMR